MSTDPIGQTLDDRYELRRVLGRGGMSIVYEARHRFTGRRVAVKVLTGDYASSPEARERLLREALALGSLRNRYVVDVLDAGLVVDVPYVVTELLDGRSLEGLVTTRGRLSCEDTARIARQVCSALTAAHARGLLHRDVKSANVIVVQGAGGEEEVRLLDFGVSHVPHAAPAGPRLTTQESLLGTPEYMAPEQLLCKPDLDGRADLYALGVVMFECLTGNVPCEGGYQGAMMQLVANTTIHVASRRTDVHPALAPIVDRCMQRDPARRFQTAMELAAALDATGLTATPTRLLQSRFRDRSLQEPSVPAPMLPPDADELPDDEPTDRHVVAAPVVSAPVAPPVPEPPRRRHRRAPYVTPVRIMAGRTAVDGRSEDISEGGLLVIAGASLAPDEVVQLRFALPTGDLAHCAAAVRWCRTRPGPAHARAALGLEFIDPSRAVREAVRSYLRIMAPAGSQPPQSMSEHTASRGG